jgi:phosphatidylglycerol---prolipoprotein diacylglyceryl transferase
MHRILFEWRGLIVWSYPAMLYCGLVAGVAAGNLGAHAMGADAFRVFVATMILIPPSIAGARLLYVAAHWSHYRSHRGRIWDRREGGMAMYGGMPVMLLLSVPVLALLGLRFAQFWDVASLTIMTGLMFTKIGCLLNGCCAGRPSNSRIAAYLPGSRGVWQSRIPIQLLEAIWAAIVLALAWAILGRLPFEGAVFLVVAAFYGTGRLTLETLREHEPGSGKIALGHAVSLATIIVALVLLVINWPRTTL